jgi:hypothetical protein
LEKFMGNLDIELTKEFVGKLKALQVKSATSILEIGKILVEA